MSFSFSGTRGSKGTWHLPRSRGGRIAEAMRSAGLSVGYDPWFIWEQPDRVLVDPRDLVVLLRRVEEAGIVGQSIGTELLIQLAAMSLRCGGNPEWLATAPFGPQLAYSAIDFERRYQQPKGYRGHTLDESTRIQPRLDRFRQSERGDLDLSGLELSELPDADLSAVTSLNLSRNAFTNVPPELRDLSDLEDLDLSYNPLHGDISPLLDCNLQKLSVEGCQLDQFQVDPSDRLSTLLVLDLSHNPLAGFEPTTGMASLLNLNLSNTGLSAVPQEIGSCSQLSHLNLSWNEIEDVAILGSNHRLGLLSVDGNKISTLPESLVSLPGLYQLQAGCNRLTESAITRASSSSSLESLFLERNPIDMPLIDNDDPFLDRLHRVSISNTDDSLTLNRHLTWQQLRAQNQ